MASIGRLVLLACCRLDWVELQAAYRHEPLAGWRRHRHWTGQSHG
jgi:hypothetical protein